MAVNPVGFEPACMEPEELEEYRAGRILGCRDCTIAFSDQQRARGRCNGIPGELLDPTMAALAAEEGLMTDQPTQLRRREPTSPRVSALQELAAAAEAAAMTQQALDVAQVAHAAAQDRLAAAQKAVAKPGKNGKHPTGLGGTPLLERPDVLPVAGAEGEPTRGILSARQQEVLDVFAKHRDRGKAAEELDISIANLEQVLDSVARKGHLDNGLIPFLPPRFAAYRQ